MDKSEAHVGYAEPSTHSTPSGPRFARLRRIIRWTARIFVALLFLIAVIIGFATSNSDMAKLTGFTESVEGWQHNTEFRQVAIQYVTRGSDAMGTTPMGMTSARWIIAIRSIPGLPKEFAINDTSEAHYRNFSKGPLSAYLHLCTEVELFGRDPNTKVVDWNGGYLPEIEAWFAKPEDVAGDKPFKYLDKQKWDWPVVKDAGAVESLRSMLHDAEVPHGTFQIRVLHINDNLKPHIVALARELNVPQDPEQMTREQQYAVFNRLDSYVRRNDPELWRTKQLSDFLGGLWGQVFSPPYTILLSPFLKAVTICRWSVIGTLVLLVALVQWRRPRRRAGPVVGDKDHARS